jgi:cellulose synthase/poly-beta-1,6-N-acetylglucosamine synthase-like glycosyltransferase
MQLMKTTPIKVSVILPVCNESAFIERGLCAILEQDYPSDCMEILIADGMSTDDTRKIVHDFASLHSQMNIQILDNPGMIAPTGLNLALRQAKGEIIIRVDGHTVIAPDYVRQCVETLQRTNADNVGGKMNAIGSNPFGKAVALATSTPFGVGGGRFHYSDKEEWVDTVYMGAWPRRVFEEIGLFDEELVRDQDDEFNYRLREHGGRILLSPAIRSEYTVRSTPRALWRQYYQYGYWKVRVLQKHPRQMRLRQFVPPAFVLALLGSILLALFSVSSLLPLQIGLNIWGSRSIPELSVGRLGWGLSLVIPLLYLIANLLASIYTASKRGWQYLPLLPLIFAILHLSYGLGFLVGLVKFANRWGDKQGKIPDWESPHV